MMVRTAALPDPERLDRRCLDRDCGRGRGIVLELATIASLDP